MFVMKTTRFALLEPTVTVVVPGNPMSRSLNIAVFDVPSLTEATLTGATLPFFVQVFGPGTTTPVHAWIGAGPP